MKSENRIIIGDSRSMRELDDRSVHLMVTSPPYWQLKDYGGITQIGFHDSYEDYINNLNLVWNECTRVLCPGCRMCINIGDQFARAAYYGRYKVIPIRTEIIRFCESVGLDYMGAIIWRKVTTTNTTGGGWVMGSYPFPRNGVLKLDYEFILIFRKPGKAPEVSREIKEQSRIGQEEWNRYFAGHWNFHGERQSKGHQAVFPEELPKRLIRMFSYVGETVLDPFLGSGTTCLAARKLKRFSVGYEINEEFLPAIREKIGLAQQSIFEEDIFEVIRQENPGVPDMEKALAGLPYMFKDPVEIQQKKESIGKTGRAWGKGEDYHRVEEIISPELLVLKDGIRIRLLGVKEIPEKRDQAAAFLKGKTAGQRVYMKFDSTAASDQDKSGNLLCYLYLSNRTHLNMHLVKNGLAGVDSEADFKYKARFEKLVLESS